MSEKLKILVLHVNAHQKEISAEEYFNNPVDSMTFSMNTSQLLFPATPVISQSLPEQSSSGGRDRDYAWGQQHGLLVTKANLAMATA